MTEDQARQRVIRAMCPEKVCRICGEPSRRIVESVGIGQRVHAIAENGRTDRHDWNAQRPQSVEYTTLGFSDCGHDDWRPGVWIDPFQKSEEGVMLTLGNIDERLD